MRPVKLALLALLPLAAACRPKSRPSETTGTTTASSAIALPPAASDAGAAVATKNAAACPALEPSKITPFATCGTNVVKSPPPDIVDASGSLNEFYERVAEIERGNQTRPIRIAVYGDSNLTSDFLTGHLRRVLQARWGDAGHGWISLARPWGSYRHEDVESKGFWPMFKLYAPTTHLVHDKQYGFANMAAQSSETGAAAWAGTTKDPKAKVGHNVSRFDFYYLKQPRGGSLTVEIDRKEVKTIATKAAAWEAAFETFDVPDGEHEFRAIVRGDGPVRWNGVSLDRPVPVEGHPERFGGVQVDSLGAGAMNFERLTWVSGDTRRPQLARRDYDLVIVWLGMNVMFVPPNKEWAKTFLGELRAAIPRVPILMLSPGDTVKDGQTKSDPRIVAVVKQVREIAAESDAAFWDFREAMGGDGSILAFTKRGLTGEDHIHFGPEGSKLMGDRLLCSFGTAYSAYISAHLEAGCHPRPPTGRGESNPP